VYSEQEARKDSVCAASFVVSQSGVLGAEQTRSVQRSNYGKTIASAGSPAASKTREPDPQQSIRTRQTVAIATTGFLENQELMPQGKNLSVRRYAGSKSLPNRRKERKMIVKMA
jgi:hypothetical protein